MKVLIATVDTDIITNVVTYQPLAIRDSLQDAIDYIRCHDYSKYIYAEKFALFTLRDRDKVTARILDNKILID